MEDNPGRSEVVIMTSALTQVQRSVKLVKLSSWCGTDGAEAAWRMDFIGSCLEVGAAEQVGGKMLLYHHRCEYTGRGALAFRCAAGGV